MHQVADRQRPGFETAMRNEMNAVLASEEFGKSPVLSKLLNYLVDETLGSRCDQLKSYSVAVDGLGRPADFDALSDSYPRVQLGRLRKALAGHYSRHGPVEDLCIYLILGSYRVRLGQMATAYPDLYRPLSAQPAVNFAVPAEDPAMFTAPAAAATPTGNTRRLSLWTGLLLALSVAGMIAFVAGRRSNRRPQAPEGVTALRSPILDLAPIQMDADPQSQRIGPLISATLADGLGRSWTTQLRTSGYEPVKDGNALPAGSRTDSFKLELQISGDAQGRHMLFARLNHTPTATLIWSKSYSLPANVDDVERAAGPLISEISGPFGAIPTYETRNLPDAVTPGYGCLLTYFDYLKSRDPPMEAKVARCLQQPVSEARLRPTILAVHAFFSLESQSGRAHPVIALRRATGYANMAVRTDPQDAYAQFAMARLAYINRECSSGNMHTDLAVAANPYDSLLIGTLTVLSSTCGYKDAGRLLDQAYALRSRSVPYTDLLLTLAAIAQGRVDRLGSLPQSDVPASGPDARIYRLNMTLMAAALGKRREASEHWARYVQLSPERQSSNDAMLGAVIISPMLRTRILAFLIEKGVVTQ